MAIVQLNNSLKTKIFNFIKIIYVIFKSLDKAIKDTDYIIHLAAIVGDQPCQVAQILLIK